MAKLGCFNVTGWLAITFLFFVLSWLRFESQSLKGNKKYNIHTCCLIPDPTEVLLNYCGMTFRRFSRKMWIILNKIKQNLSNVHCNCMKIVVGRCHTLCYVPLLYKPMMRPNNRYQVANFCLLRDFTQKIQGFEYLLWVIESLFKKIIVKTWKLTNILLNQRSIKMNM